MSDVVSFKARPLAPSERLQGLDALRGLLVLFVACYHLSVWTGLYPAGSFGNMSWAKLGNYSVSAFFILSGFLLFRLSPWEKVRAEGVGSFYFKRWLRLAPLFYLAVAINLLLGLGMGPKPSVPFVLQNLSLCFGLTHPNIALVTGGWYVGLVVLLYAAYPLWAWIQAKLGVWVLLLLVLGLWLWSLPWTLHGVMEASPSNRFHMYVLPANQVFLFALGGMLAEGHSRIQKRLSWQVFLPLVALVFFLWLRPSSQFFDHLEVLSSWARYQYLLLMAGLVMLFALRGPWPKGLDLPLAKLGLWSYAAYLLHPFVFRCVKSRLHGWDAFWASLLLSIAVAALAERWIERPLGRLGKKK